MTATASDVLALTSEQHMVMARQLVRQLSQQCGFSLVDQTKMVTAASELGRNTLKYGGGGEMRCEILREGVRTGLRLTFKDDGPGIADIDQAMSDGFTSGSGLGMGLPGTKRLVNDFHIESVVGRGTIVTITRWK